MSFHVHHDGCTEVDDGRIPACVATHAVFEGSVAANPRCRGLHRTEACRSSNLPPAHTLVKIVSQVVQPSWLNCAGEKWLLCSFGKKIYCLAMTCGVAEAA